MKSFFCLRTYSFVALTVTLLVSNIVRATTLETCLQTSTTEDDRYVCYKAEEDSADVALNTAYQARLKLGDGTFQANLKSNELLWIQNRDQACQNNNPAVMGSQNSVAATLAIQCMTAVTRIRTFILSGRP